MSQNIQALNQAIADAAPINGVSIGDWADKTTWRVDFQTDATQAQKNAAQTIINNWDASAPAPPMTAPMWAVRTVLQNNGLFNQAQTLIDASTDNALKNVWEYGNFADRNSKAIASLGTTLNLTDAQVDKMFIDANSLDV